MKKELNLEDFYYIAQISLDQLNHLIQLGNGQSFVILNSADNML